MPTINLSVLKLEEKQTKLEWSIKVRYTAILLILVVLLMSKLFGGVLPVTLILILVVIAIINNFLFSLIYQRGKFLNTLPYIGITIDLLSITFLVHFTGGLSSPFMFLYFIEIIGATIHIGPWTAVWASFMATILIMIEGVLNTTTAVKTFHPFKYTETINFSEPIYLIIYSLSFLSGQLFAVYVLSYISNRLRIVETSLIDANRHLRKQYKQLQEVDELKSEFVSIASHQLRTPLSAIKWSIKMLLDGEFGSLAKDQHHFLKKTYQSNERMIDLINDLLNISKIEQKKFKYEFKEEVLSHLISQLVAEVQPIAKTKKISLITSWPKQDIPKIKIDKNKMKLALQNLLDNAIKYTPLGGQVTISTEYDKLNIIITIKDTGIGIPADQTDKLFSKFFRADNAIKLQTEGSGLGLFIVKDIIEKHGGNITLVSKIDKGTTATITLPLKT